MFFATAPVAAAAVSRARAFTRYAFAVQYHGGSLLGFSYQGPKGENCLVYDKRGSIQADLRGIESVEGRTRRALDMLVGYGNYRNIQVSSRTDRGVHAWRNTFQVDIRPRLPAREARKKTTDADSNGAASVWRPRNLANGINYYLSRLPGYPTSNEAEDSSSDGSESRYLHRESLNNNICILSSTVAPDERIINKYYDPNLPESDTNPKTLPWDVRYTATRRTYAYQILHSYDEEDVSISDGVHHEREAQHATCHHSQPFEHDRVWRIHEKGRRTLNIDAMNLAGRHLVGTHDFSSFRGKGCQRSSPVVTLEDVWVGEEGYNGSECGGILGAVWRREQEKENSRQWSLPSLHTPKTLRLVTIMFTGKSFVYHQVRNMVACLVEVGRGRMSPGNVRDILEERDRSCAPGMAPARGLFLVDVEHGDFRF